MRKRFSTRQQIFESVEGAILEAISAQVLGISLTISATRDVEISMFIQGVLPEEERRYLEVVVEEILYGPPWVANVRISVLDHALQPLKPNGNWMFIRKGVQAERSSPTASVQEDEQPAGEHERRSLRRQSACQSLRRTARRLPDDLSGNASLHL